MSTYRKLMRRFPRIPLVFSRRAFLKRLGATTAVPLLPACSIPGALDSPASRAASGTAAEFRHGVASGDPLSDRVILWTRVTPAAGASEVPVEWSVATDPQLAAVVASGSFTTNADRDFTVKVDAEGLASYTTYYYQFRVGEAKSPIGRTKTAPKASEATRLRAGVVACANYTFGYFNGYATLAKRPDLDVVLHLGDYLYEGGGGTIRTHAPDKEMTTLEDYRGRHAQYKQDADLAELHRQNPFITIWDDHESTNNSYSTGADNHTEGAEGSWDQREGWAVRAYFEWMPIRDNPVTALDSLTRDGLAPEGNGRTWRTLSYGGLADFIMLDTRLAGRAPQNGTAIVSEEQTILGAEQREWLLRQLASSTATWKIVGQQMTFAPMQTQPGTPAGEGAYLNEDAWDGYRYDRNAVFDAVEQHDVQNLVVLSGDIHATIACDLPRHPTDGSYNPATGAGSLGVELCSNGIAQVPLPIWTGLRATNPHLKHTNEEQLGYLLMDITPERVQAEWYYSLTVFQPLAQEVADPVMLACASGSRHLAPAATRTSARLDAAPLAP